MNTVGGFESGFATLEMRSLAKLGLVASGGFFLALGLAVWAYLLPDGTEAAALIYAVLIFGYVCLYTLIICACVSRSSPDVVEKWMKACRWMTTGLVVGSLVIAAVDAVVGAILLAAGVDGGRTLLIWCLWVGAIFLVLACGWFAAFRGLLPQIKACRAADEEQLCALTPPPQYTYFPAGV